MENDHEEKKLVCLVCGGLSPTFFAQKNGYDLRKCRICGLVFVWPMPISTVGVYTADYFAGAKGGHGYVDYDKDKTAMAGTFVKYMQILEDLSDERDRRRLGLSQAGAGHGKLLDVGAATGYFMGLARQRGWQASGVEISDYAASAGRVKGLDVRTGTLASVGLAPGYFDVITLWDVIEHMPNPRAEVEIAARLLRRDGLIAINTPDISSLLAKVLGKRWHLMVPPEHLVYFNKQSLCQLLEGLGFKVVLTDKIGKKFTLQYILEILANWQELSIWRGLLKAVKDNRVGRLPISINLRDNLFLVARKI